MTDKGTEMPTASVPSDTRTEIDQVQDTNPEERSLDNSPSAEGNHDVLASIDARLQKLDILDVLRQDVQQVKQTSESTCATLDEYKKKTDTLETAVTKLESTVKEMKTENGQMKEEVLEMKCRSMKNNLTLSGLKETPDEDAEKMLRQFFIKELHMDAETVEKFEFERVHRIPHSRENQGKPCLLLAKFVHYKDKALVKSFAKHLAGKPYRLNDQFPPEILARRRKLMPKLKEHREKKDTARLVRDKLYINGILFEDKEITPWLFNSR